MFSYRQLSEVQMLRDLDLNLVSGQCHISIHSTCMGVDPWVDRGTCPPYFLKWRDALCFVPLLSGVDIFCNAQLHSNNYSLQFI